jgi:hypothetical protein
VKILSLLRDILYYGFAIFKHLKIAIKKKVIGDAIDNSDEDQRPIEEVISDTAGEPTKHEYDGLQSRDSKKRS